MKNVVTPDNLPTAEWFPEDYDWEPITNEPRPTQGGGTAVWSKTDAAWIFEEPPPCFPEFKQDDLVPEEWSIL